MTSFRGYSKLIEKNIYVFCAFLVFLTITSSILLWESLINLDIYKIYQVFVPSSYVLVSNILYIASIVVLIIIFVGCAVAIKGTNYMIFALTIVLGIVSGIQLGAGFGSSYLVNYSEKILKGKLQRTLPLYLSNKFPNVAETWNNVQRKFDCCGVDSYQDWVDAFGRLPSSCCDPLSRTINETKCSPSGIRTNGCYKQLNRFIRNYQLELAITTIVLALLQFIGMGIIFVCYVKRNGKADGKYIIDKKKHPPPNFIPYKF